MTSRSRQRSICLFLIALGSAVSGYLLFRTFVLLSGTGADVIDICSAVFGAGCDTTLASRSSWLLGVPLAAWGLVYYITLTSLLVSGWLLGGAFELQTRVAVMLLATAGVLVSVALGGIILFGQVAFCPFCLVVQALNLALLPAVWVTIGGSTADGRRSLSSGWKYLRGQESSDSRETRWELVGFVAVALVAIATYQWALVQSERYRAAGSSGFDPDQILGEFAFTPKQDVPVSPENPRLGPGGAPVQVVVFSSFQCPGCRAMAQLLERLHRQYPERLTIVFKHFPLGTACNPQVEYDKHTRSCEAAWAAEAARRQGKFWTFHDALFASDLEFREDTILAVSEETGIERSQFDEDRRGEAVREQVLSDIELGNRLGVRSTPTAFLNGRRIKHLARRVFEILIEEESRPGRP